MQTKMEMQSETSVQIPHTSTPNVDNLVKNVTWDRIPEIWQLRRIVFIKQTRCLIFHTHLFQTWDLNELLYDKYKNSFRTNDADMEKCIKKLNQAIIIQKILK